MGRGFNKNPKFTGTTNKYSVLVWAGMYDPNGKENTVLVLNHIKFVYRGDDDHYFQDTLSNLFSE